MGIMYRKFKPSEYVMVIKKGKVIKQGNGLTVFCNNLTTNLVAIPATAFDGAFAFEDLITADFQAVCVQGVTTYRICDFTKANVMADFTFVPGNKNKENDALALINRRINNIIKAIIIREVGMRDIRTIIKQADEMAEIIVEKLKTDEIIEGLGVEIINVSVLGITAKPETRKALEASAREQILKEQDDAIYLRRNAAIEQERLIKENELNTEIKVAEKEKEKQDKEQEIKKAALEAKLRLEEIEAEKKAKLKKQDMENKIELEKRNKDYVAIEIENEKCKNDEKARALAAMIKAYENMNVALVEACALANMDPEAIMAKGFMELGANADKIGTLNLGPDILERFAGAINKE